MISMDLLRPIKTASIILGFALIFMAGWTNTVSLIFAGIGFLGLYSILLGYETIQHRYHPGETDRLDIIKGKYREWGDVAQGVLFITLGVVLVGFCLSLFLGLSQVLIRFLIRRPGAIFFALGMVCILRAVNIIAGSKQQTNSKSGDHPVTFFQWVEYFFANLIPASFMFILGMLLFGMGVFETVSPNGFDLLGGGIIDTFFGGW
jgi:hypothetical protein